MREWSPVPDDDRPMKGLKTMKRTEYEKFMIKQFTKFINDVLRKDDIKHFAILHDGNTYALSDGYVVTYIPKTLTHGIVISTTQIRNNLRFHDGESSARVFTLFDSDREEVDHFLTVPTKDGRRGVVLMNEDIGFKYISEKNFKNAPVNVATSITYSPSKHAVTFWWFDIPMMSIMEVRYKPEQ